jgi:hypothetical protein
MSSLQLRYLEALRHTGGILSPEHEQACIAEIKHMNAAELRQAIAASVGEN